MGIVGAYNVGSISLKYNSLVQSNKINFSSYEIKEFEEDKKSFAAG